MISAVGTWVRGTLQGALRLKGGGKNGWTLEREGGDGPSTQRE